MLSTCYHLAINYFMAIHLPGTGATVNGTSHVAPQGQSSKERWCYGLLASLEAEEYTLPREVNRTDRVTITVNLSDQLANIDLLLNVMASNAPGGNTTYSASHYLKNSIFSSGTGGDSSAENLAQAAMEAVISLKLIELDKSRRMNPDKTVITRCQHVIASSGGSNATFSALLEFPIKVLNLPGGGSLIEGKDFLT